jgi:two-component system, response regulator RegA
MRVDGQANEVSDRVGGKDKILIADDDDLLLDLLSAAFQERGFEVIGVSSVASAIMKIMAHAPPLAVVDVKLADGNGLTVLDFLRQSRPDARAVIVSGYGSIQCAVSATKLGALDFFQKLVDADVIASVLLGRPEVMLQPTAKVMSAERARWEHIQRTLQECERNISEAARRLRMHRRTLQRILAMHARQRPRNPACPEDLAKLNEKH